jgi:hypothetical protein
VFFERQGVPKKRLLTFADEGTVVLLSVGNHSSKNAPLHPKRPEPPQKCSYEKPRSRKFTLLYFTLPYFVYGHRFIPDVLYSPGSYYCPANHEQTDLTGSRCGRPVTIYTCIRFLVRTSAKTTAVLTDIFVIFVSSNTQKPGGNTIIDYELLLSNPFQFNGIHVSHQMLKLKNISTNAVHYNTHILQLEH